MNPVCFVAFSAQDARRVMDNSTKNNQRLISNGPFDLNARDVREEIDSLVQDSVSGFYSSVSTAARGEYDNYTCILRRNDTIVVRQFKRYTLNPEQITSIHDILFDRVLATLREQGYRVVYDNNQCTVSWSTSSTRKYWRLLIAHLVIRGILKKYVRRRLEEWLTPPNGWLYLKAKLDFNSL